MGSNPTLSATTRRNTLIALVIVAQAVFYPQVHPQFGQPSVLGWQKVPMARWVLVPSLRNLHRGSELNGFGHLPETLMHTPDLFLARATECETMAKIAREPDSRATWMRMAERWHRCAQLEMRASAAVTHHASEPDRHRRASPGWSRH